MKGVVQVAGELSPEISPVMVLEDNAIEWQFLQQVRVCGSATLVPGIGGNPSVVQWNNPANSGVIAVFSHLDFQMDILASANFGYSAAAALASAASTAVFDKRWGTQTDPTTIRVTSTNAGVGIALTSSIFVARLNSNRNYPWEGQVVLLPDDSLEFGTPGLNVGIRVNARWTERQLPALEE